MSIDHNGRVSHYCVRWRRRTGRGARKDTGPEKPLARANTLLGMTRGGIGSTVVRVHRTVGRGVTVYRLKGGTKAPTNLQSAALAHYRTAPGVRGE